jgi:hypothetical protein
MRKEITPAVGRGFSVVVQVVVLGNRDCGGAGCALPDVCARHQLPPCPRYTSFAPSLGCSALLPLLLVLSHCRLPSQVSMRNTLHGRDSYS